MAISRTWYAAFVDDDGSGTVGTVLDKADLDSLHDAIDGLGGTRASVYNAVVQSVPNAALTAVAFNTETFDTASVHSTTVNTSRMTIPGGADGIYLAVGKVVFAPNGTGVRQVRIRKNGADVATCSNTPAGAGTEMIVAIQSIVSLVGNDYLEMFAYQSSGAALNTGDPSSRALQNEFTVVRLS